jgi:sugar/nucleoside kinase (ribokinase family)
MLGGPAATGRWLPGGAAPTVALAAAHAGARVRLWHPRPASAFDPAFRNLVRAGVDVSMAPLGGEAARCLVLRSADRNWLWSSTPPSLEIGGAERLLESVDHVVICPRWGSWAKALVEVAATREIRVSAVGFVPRGRKRWSVVVVSEHQLEPSEARRIDAQMLVITRGVAGASIRLGAEWLEIPAFPASLVDATGAGDVFGGTFIARIDAGSSVREAARMAAEAAARCCEDWGAQSSLLRRGGAAAAQRERRVRGALAGLACGDAFGMPASFIEPAIGARLWPAGIQEMLPAPAESPYHAGYPAGRVPNRVWR